MENVKLNFLHICDYISFSEGGKLNVIGIFKNINVKSVPAVHPLMFIVLNFSVYKSGKYELVLKIVNEKNKIEIAKQNFDLNISIPKGKKQAEVGITGQFNNIKFENYGKHKIQAFLNNNVIAENAIDLIKN